MDDGPDPPRLQEAPDPPRLQKVIAASGVTSRRNAEEWIRSGRVQVDGATARLGDRADPETAAVTVDGVPLPVRPGLVTYLLNKPAGVVSTSADPQGRPTVVGLVPTEPKVFPVGRLDADSEGLLLLTERRRVGQPGHPSALRDHQDLQRDGRGPSRRGDAPRFGARRRTRRWAGGGDIGEAARVEWREVASRVDDGRGSKSARSVACSTRSGTRSSACSTLPSARSPTRA